jgi:hypothetical protein
MKVIAAITIRKADEVTMMMDGGDEVNNGENRDTNNSKIYWALWVLHSSKHLICSDLFNYYCPIQ